MICRQAVWTLMWVNAPRMQNGTKMRHEPKSGAHRGFGDAAKVVKSGKSLNHFALFRRVGILETPEPGLIWRIYPRNDAVRCPF
jgi:hypothetical protein